MLCLGLPTITANCYPQTWHCPTSPQQLPQSRAFPPGYTGSILSLRGHLSKDDRTADKELRTRNWRRASSILEHRRYSLFSIRKKY
jgi:hypothetical protein